MSAQAEGLSSLARDSLIIITAGHCLPFLPPSHPCAYPEERTYPQFLGAVGGERSVWAECLFVDPVSDLALLGPVDAQEMPDEAEAYEELVSRDEPFKVGDAPDHGLVRLQALDGSWFQGAVRRAGSGLWFQDLQSPIAFGMSGSPIIGADGSAIGVVCTSDAAGNKGGPNACLFEHQPAGRLREFIEAGRAGEGMD